MDIPEPVKIKHPVLEKDVEAYLVKRVEKIGGKAYKWSSPNNRGVPDRMCFIAGTLFLIEVKAEKGELTRNQKRGHQTLASLGFPVGTLYGKADVDEFIAGVLQLQKSVAELQEALAEMPRYTDLRHYQQQAIDHLLLHPDAMLHLDMGLGKTVITLTAYAMLNDFDLVNSALVVAPKRPALAVWEAEKAKWNHTRHLKVSYAMGSARERLRALYRKADLYIINYENLSWLRAQLEAFWLRRGQELPFDMLVFDEVDRMKNASTNRVKDFSDVLPYFRRRVGLTGTPASNGLQDLHGQYLVVDGGQRLGVSFHAFKNRYFVEDEHSRRLAPRVDTHERIAAAVADITLQMRAADHIDMPTLVINDVWVDLPPPVRAKYDQLEKDFFLELDSGVELDVANEAAKVNKCLQVANGAVYLIPGEPRYEVVHSEKLDAWEEIRNQLGDEPLLTGYRFKFDYLMLQKRFRDVVNLTLAKDSEIPRYCELFNTGTLKNLIGHPLSMGHGLNLQGTCHHVCMIGCPWSLSQYLQFVARVQRQGQSSSHVVLHRILAKDTLDEAVIVRLEHKDEEQLAIRDAIMRYRQQHMRMQNVH